MMGIGTGYPYNPMLIPPVGPSYTVYPVDQGMMVQPAAGYSNPDPRISVSGNYPLDQYQSDAASLQSDMRQLQLGGAAGTNAPRQQFQAVPLAPTPAGQPMQLGQRYPAPAPQRRGKGGSAPSPTALERRRRMAEAFLQQGMDTSPISSPWQGAARLADALVGGLSMRRADQQEQAARDASNAQFMQAIQGGQMTPEALGALVSDPWSNSSQQQLAARIWENQNPPPDEFTRYYDQYLHDAAAAGQPVKTKTEMYQLFEQLRHPQSSTNIYPGETQQAKTIGENLGKEQIQIQNDASTAQTAVEGYDQMKRALDNPGVYTGIGQPTVAATQQLGYALGITDPQTLADSEAFDSAATKSIKDELGSLGTGVSNADVSFIARSAPGSTHSKPGNYAIIEMKKRLAERKIEIGQLASDYAAQHNGLLDVGWFRAKAEWAKQHPLFTDQEKNSITTQLNDVRKTIPQRGGAPDAGPPPEGVTQQEWNAMTPQDRALWQH